MTHKIIRHVRFINIQNIFLCPKLYVWSKVGFYVEIYCRQYQFRCKVVTSGFPLRLSSWSTTGFLEYREPCVAIVIRLEDSSEKDCTKKEKIDVIRLRAAVGRSASWGRSRRGRIRAASVTATAATSGTASLQAHHGIQVAESVRQNQEKKLQKIIYILYIRIYRETENKTLDVLQR